MNPGDNNQAGQSKAPQDNGLPVASSQANIGGDSLVGLVDTLQSVDTTGPNAKVNETSIEDNKGGRIKLVDDAGNGAGAIKK